MRIAQIAPICLSLPPVSYGGTELIVSSLTESLVKRGHEVTLYASGDSNEVIVKKINLALHGDVSAGYMQNCANLEVFEGYKKECSNASRVEDEILYFPIYFGLKAPELSYISKAIRQITKN